MVLDFECRAISFVTFFSLISQRLETRRTHIYIIYMHRYFLDAIWQSSLEFRYTIPKGFFLFWWNLFSVWIEYSCFMIRFQIFMHQACRPINMIFYFVFTGSCTAHTLCEHCRLFFLLGEFSRWNRQANLTFSAYFSRYEVLDS